MRISDIGQWMSRIAPLKADEAQAKKESDPVIPEKTEEIAVSFKNQAYVRYLAHKYIMNEMTLNEWKNFQMEAAEMGLVPVKSVLNFAKQTEHKIFHLSSSALLNEEVGEATNPEQHNPEIKPNQLVGSLIKLEPKNMLFELGELLKQPNGYTAKQQLREWHALVQSITHINPKL